MTLDEAFAAGLELAWTQAKADEMDPPNSSVWECARARIAATGGVPAPMVSPLQLGGAAVEWHGHGLNIEARFRDVSGGFYLVIEDRLREVPLREGRCTTMRPMMTALEVYMRRATEAGTGEDDG